MQQEMVSWQQHQLNHCKAFAPHIRQISNHLITDWMLFLMPNNSFKALTAIQHSAQITRWNKINDLCVCGSSTSTSPTGDWYRRTSGDSSFTLSRIVLSCNGNSCAWNTASLTVLCSWNVAPFGRRVNESKTTTYGDLPASVALCRLQSTSSICKSLLHKYYIGLIHVHRYVSLKPAV